MQNLLALLTTNEELAVMEMQRIRARVLQARTFMDELRGVFAEVRSSRAAMAAMEQTPVKSWRLTRQRRVLAKPRAVSVLFSAQVRLSGRIVRGVFESFLEHVRSQPGDVIVVGKVGRDLFEETGGGREYTYIDLPDTREVGSVSTRLAKTLLAYDDVRIFHGRFVNLVEQTPDVATLAINPLLAATAVNQGMNVQFVFEPSAHVVTQFFDEQVASALVAQILSESSLALLGSRITAIERSQQLVQSSLARAYARDRLAERAQANREQAQRLAGMALWYA